MRKWTRRQPAPGFTPTELMHMAGCSYQTIMAALKKRSLRAAKIGRRWSIDPRSAADFIAANRNA